MQNAGQVCGAVLLGVVALLGSSEAPAQASYPTKPVRLIVPFAPGGGTDIVARVIAQKATELSKQSVVVDNRCQLAGARPKSGQVHISGKGCHKTAGNVDLA